MKPLEYVKKYKLDSGVNFSHKHFAMDFGNDFNSRLEVYKMFSTWGDAKFWSLLDEMFNKWDQINNKTLGVLPDGLIGYIRNAIFIPTYELEFPEVKEFKDLVDVSLIKELKQLIRERVDLLSKRREVRYSWEEPYSDVDFEWDHNYMDNAIGVLGIRPTFGYHQLSKKLDELNDHCLYYAFSKLTYQLSKRATARANVQFRMRKEWEDSRSREKFSWFDYLFSTNIRVNLDEYKTYITLLRLEQDFKAEDVSKQYRQLSLIHHPDKGGNSEKFIELTEAKNKCLEYLKLKTN